LLGNPIFLKKFEYRFLFKLLFHLVADMNIKLNNCTIYMKDEVILEDVFLDIDNGIFLRIKGENGSGKTVLLNTILGLNKNTSGSISRKYDKADLCYISDTPFFFDDEKVEEVIWTLAKFYSSTYKVLEDISSTLNLNLASIKKKKIYELSKGTRKKMMILPLFIETSKCLVLDEIFTGLDLDTQAFVCERLVKKSVQGATIIIVEHNESIMETIKKNITVEEIECKNKKIQVAI